LRLASAIQLLPTSMGALVLLHQDAGERLADDVRAAADHDVLAGGLVAGAAEQFDDSGGRGGPGRGLAAQQLAEARRRYTVGVFGGVDRGDDGRLLHLLRQRQLNEDAVKARVGVERGDAGDDLVLRRVLRQVGHLGEETGFLGLVALGAHVGER